MSYSYLQNQYGPPAEAVCYGCQNDGGGKMWSAIAHTEHGPIGGKASRDTCYYSFGGREHCTKHFSWLTAPEGRVVPVRNKGAPPPKAASLGRQRNDNAEYFAAIAICDQGLIPGKAAGNNCWYAYGGQEHCTSDFMWLVSL